MKLLFALLALPAATLAAPAELAARQNPPNYVQDNVACGCLNAAGQPDPNINCPYGEKLGAAGEMTGFCAPVSQYSAPMSKIMTPEHCARYSPDYPKTVCKDYKQCLRYPGCPRLVNQFDVCGLPLRPKPERYYCGA